MNYSFVKFTFSLWFVKIKKYPPLPGPQWGVGQPGGGGQATCARLRGGHDGGHGGQVTADLCHGGTAKAAFLCEVEV